MGDILIRKQDCCNKENTLISETCEYLKIKQKKVSFIGSFMGTRKKLNLWRESWTSKGKRSWGSGRKLSLWSAISRRHWSGGTAIVVYLFVFGICFGLGVNLLQGPVARWGAWLKFGQKKTKQRVSIGQLRMLGHYYWGLFWELNGSYYAES